MTDRSRPLANRRIVLGVGGGIAAYKAAELVRLLVKADARVQVAMTRSSREFVAPATFQALSGAPVFTDLFDLSQESEIGHIRVADGADLVIVAPATANLIARMAAGMADDPVTAVCLATRAPVLVAPAMNVNMWESPLTRDNVRRLREVAGVQVVGPGAGFLACHWTGPGRLAEPADIVEAAARISTEADLEGRRVVVSAGPTREALDPVRFLGNRSSGKMGYALAAAAARRGAAVTLVSGPVALESPLGVETVSVVSAREMRAAVLDAASSADAVIMAAAVADYRPAAAAPQKLKKGEADETRELTLARNPDILAELGRRRSGSTPVLVGFAAETEELEERARAKLASKRCDVVVANDVSAADAGFEVDENRVIIVRPDGEASVLPLGSKSAIAHAVLDEVVARLRGG